MQPHQQRVIDEQAQLQDHVTKLDAFIISDTFKTLPFDQDLMESSIVDQKVENLLGVLEWDILAHTDTKTTFDDLFSWD
jgi:hypothetical protein